MRHVHYTAQGGTMAKSLPPPAATEREPATTFRAFGQESSEQMIETEIFRAAVQSEDFSEHSSSGYCAVVLADSDNLPYTSS
jgi:hypothetical protein